MIDPREARTQPESPGCLRIDELVAMIDGTLEAKLSEAVLAHVDCCADCAEVIANLGSLDGQRRRIDRYQIERVLGSGGMGIVYAAFDPELQRRVAIKLVRPDAISERLQSYMVKEARSLARVSHPNVVTVYDVGEHDGEIYLATELVDGLTLADWQIGRSRGEIIDAWLQVARGLAAAHAEGVVHRDVKPSNIFVGRDGRVRVGDFGIAHLGTPQEVTPLPIVAVGSPAGPVVGTPAYMAPEQKSGRVDARADQFATAVCIVEALTETRPAPDAEIALEPPALAAALTRALRTDPDERFPTMLAFADAIVAATAPPKRPRRWHLAALAVGVAAIAVPLAWRAARSESPACSVATIPAEVWSPARRAHLAATLPTDPTRSLERWARLWSVAAADVCTTSGSDASLRARRERCLADMLVKFDGTLAQLESTAVPERLRTMKIVALVDMLPHAAWCSRAGVLATVERESLADRQAREQPSSSSLASSPPHAAFWAAP